jgi:hypothetical protein
MFPVRALVSERGAVTAGLRRLEISDEPALQALLRRVYGDTYSYRALYEPGGVAALLRSGAVLWGDFADTGELIGHTGLFFKDPRGDYVESGMSLRNIAAQPRTRDAEGWRHLLGWLGDRCAYVHQNTTTWHPLAQRYAERHMRARPTGVIVGYTVGERLIQLRHPDGPMHALTMSTRLAAGPIAGYLAPEGPWSELIATVLGGLGAAPRGVVRAAHLRVGLEAIERNDALGLRRRAVVAGGDDAGSIAPEPGTRVDLVHLPLDERVAALADLERAGYVPVGVRPHATRPHELVLQFLPGALRVEAIAALAAARLTPAGQAFVAAWQHACAQAS